MGLAKKLYETAVASREEVSVEAMRYADCMIWPDIVKYIQIAADKGKFKETVCYPTHKWINVSIIISYIQNLCNKEGLDMDYQLNKQNGTITFDIDWSNAIEYEIVGRL